MVLNVVIPQFKTHAEKVEWAKQFGGKVSEPKQLGYWA